MSNLIFQSLCSIINKSYYPKLSWYTILASWNEKACSVDKSLIGMELYRIFCVCITLFCAVKCELSLPTYSNYENIQKCIKNITASYTGKRNIIFLSEEINESDFMSSLLNIIEGPKKLLSENYLSPKNLTHEEKFFIFLAQKHKYYSKILESLLTFENSRFLIIWLETESSNIYIRSIFQEFWSFEMLDVIALVQLNYGRLSVYTYFPYTKTQCADSGTPVMIDTWNPRNNRFTRKVNLFGRKNKVYNLQGCPLKCAGAHRPPDSVIEETGNKTYNLSGIGGLLLETIATKLNFTPVIVRVVDITSNYDAIYSNESSAISIDVGTKKVDIGFGIFTRLLDYHPKVTFVKVTNMDCFTWAVPPNAGVGPSMWTTYVGEFSNVIWALIGLTIILAIPIFYFLTKLALNEKPHFKKWEFLGFFVYFTFLGASVEQKPHSNAVRMFLAQWLFYCLVLGAAYNAQLGSFATVPKKVGNIESTYELIKTDFSITGTPQMFYILNASINSNQAIKVLLERFEVLPPGSFQQVVEKVVVNRNIALFSTKNLLAYSNERLKTHNLPPSYLQPVCVIKSPSSPMIVRSVSPLREPLSVIIDRLFEAGILSRWEADAKQQTNNRGFQVEPKLYLEQMQAAFLLLISGLLLSVVVFIAELVVYRWIRPPPDLMTQLVLQGYKIPFRK